MKIGERLPNGAILIAETELSSDEKIILAIRDYSYKPYVTWKVFHNDYKTTTSGGYHKKLSTAYHDYLNRGGDGYL